MNSTTKASPMTRDETMMFVQLVTGNTIIMSKATNATNNKLKLEAWQRLADSFNSSISSFPRTPAQLRLKWENLKKSARKRCANMKSSLNKTGGGKGYFPPDDVLDKVASLLGNTCTGFTVEFGGDSIIENTESQVHEAIIIGDCGGDEDGVPDGDGCLDNDGVTDGDGGGNGGGHGVDVTPLHTPTSAKSFFFGKASGSGTLAKRKRRMEEEKHKARILRENAISEYLMAKKKKIDLVNEEEDLRVTQTKLELEKTKIELENAKLKLESVKLELENVKLENIKLKQDVNFFD